MFLIKTNIKIRLDDQLYHNVTEIPNLKSYFCFLCIAVELMHFYTSYDKNRAGWAGPGIVQAQTQIVMPAKKLS